MMLFFTFVPRIGLPLPSVSLPEFLVYMAPIYSGMSISDSEHSALPSLPSWFAFELSALYTH